MEYLTQEGRFAAKIINADIAKSENTGTFSIWLDFEVEGDRTIQTNLWLTEKVGKDGIDGLERARKTLVNALALKPETSIDTIIEHIDALKGKECSITTKREPMFDKDGKPKMGKDGMQRMRTVVAFMNPLSAAPNISSAEKQALLARIRKIRTSPARPQAQTSNEPF